LEETLRDRLASLSRQEMVALGAVVVLMLAGGGFWYVRSLPRPVDVVRRPAAPAFAEPVAAPAATSSPSSVFVHVAGEVRRPGVYAFVEGDRVIDAIDAAGGARGDAALDELNLAAPLTDGSQVLVPERSADPSAVDDGPMTSGPAEEGTELINVNTADATELEQLPGIGPSTAGRIVRSRDQRPFGNVEELQTRGLVTARVLADIRDLVTLR
jgi:competence protein ComEA